MTIKQKQWQLYYLGYYGGKIDGIWGAGSKAATLRFQKDHGLDADGIFGGKHARKNRRGLRCPRHNANVGGVSDSRHLSGKAIDLRIEGKSARQTLTWAKKQSEVRYAYVIDANYVHMDIV